MADAPVVHIGENSPEEVAFKLYGIIGSIENKTTSGGHEREHGGAHSSTMSRFFRARKSHHLRATMFPSVICPKRGAPFRIPSVTKSSARWP